MKFISIITVFVFVYVPLKAQLKANFGSINTTGCAPFIIQFSDSTTGGTPLSWAWNFGNGQTSTEKNPLVKYNNAGVYTVTLTVTDNSSNSTIQKKGYITVNPQPVIYNISVTDKNICFPAIETFSARVLKPENITDWLWDFGDGDSSIEINPVHNYTASGDFNISLTLKNIYGCETQLNEATTITVNNSINIDFNYRYRDICTAPSTIQFSGKGVSNDSIYYQWYFGNGNTSNDVNAVQIYNVPGSYNVELIGTTFPSGCTDTIIKTIKIGSPSVDFVLPQSGCLNSPLLFIDSSLPKPISETWDFGDGTTATTSNRNIYHTYIKAGTFNVTLVCNFGNCSKTITKSITISQKPSAVFTASGDLVSCIYPQTISFINSSSGATSYKWNFGDSTSSNKTNETHTYSNQGIFSVSLIASNSSGCSDTSVQPNLIKLQPFKITSVGTTPFTGCAPQTIQFNPQINTRTPIVSYKWDLGDGTESDLPTPTHFYNSPGNYTVKLIAVNRTGCLDTFLLGNAVGLGVKPKVDFDAMPKDTCASDTIQFTDLSASTVTSWLWDFGDGQTSILQNPLHNYVDTGLFNIKLVAAINNCANTLIKYRFVHIKPPVAKFNVKIDCKNYNLIQFNNTSIGGNNFLWKFGDNDTSIKTSPFHFFKMPGDYNVSLTAFNNNGCTYKTDKIVTVLDTLGLLTVSPVKTYYCKYDTIHFELFNYNPDYIKTITWNFGDSVVIGPLDPTVESRVYSYLKPGNFNPFMVVRNLYNCRDTFSLKNSIDVFGPTASFSNPTAVCTNTNVIFTDFSLPYQNDSIVNWKWIYGDGKTETKTAPPFQHTYSKPGIFTAELKVTDSKGCFDSAYSITPVQVSTVNLNAGNDTTICLGTQLTLNPSGADVYSWLPNTTLSCTDCVNPVAKPQANQIYYLTGSSLEGCVANDTITVNVQPPVNLNVSGVDSLCAGDFDILTASGAVNYTWIPSDQSASLSGSTIKILPKTPIDYTVIGSDAFSCFSDTQYIHVPVFPKPEIKFPDTLVTLPAGSSYNLQPFISDDITFLQWTPLNYLSCTNCKAPVVSPYRTTTYTLTASNIGGCTTKANVTIQIICKSSQIFIPNTFSPNNDGMNDVFYPRGKGIFSIRSFKIFNRIGQLIFENHNFSSNDPAEGWNGNYRGNKTPSDVYIYLVDLICENNELITLKGNVTLLR